MDTLRSAAHLQLEIGDIIFASLVGPDNIEAVREFASTLVSRQPAAVDGRSGERKFLFLSFVPGDKVSVSGDELLKICGQLPGREPTQEDGEYLLISQHLIPKRDFFQENKKYLVITGWRSPFDSNCVACLRWGGDQWVRFWRRLTELYFDDSGLAIRIDE